MATSYIYTKNNIKIISQLSHVPCRVKAVCLVIVSWQLGWSTALEGAAEEFLCSPSPADDCDEVSADMMDHEIININ